MSDSSQPHTVQGILQARILEWVAFRFSRGSSQPWDPTQVSGNAEGFFTNWAIMEAMNLFTKSVIKPPHVRFKSEI